MNRLFKDKYLIFLLACLLMFIGAFLRIYELFQQMLMGDEWHSFNVASSGSLWQIYSDFFNGGHSIPLAFYYYILLKINFLNEFLIYLPNLIGGIFLIFIPSFFVRKYFDRAVLLFLLSLLASSTILIFYSRFVRPYGLTTGLAFMALIICFLWWKNKKISYGILYAVLFNLSVYFHVISIPFVLSPLLFVLVQIFVSNNFQLRVFFNKKYLIPIFTLILLFFILYGFQLDDLISATEVRAGEADVVFRDVFSGFRTLVAGNANMLVYSVFILLFLISFFLKKQNKQQSELIRFIVFPVLLQFVFVILIKPEAIDLQHIFARYMIFVLPVIFLLVSFSLFRIIKTVFRRKVFLMFVVVLFSILPFTLFPYNTFFNCPSNSRHTALLGYLVFGKKSTEQAINYYIQNTKDFYSKYVRTFEGNPIVVESPFHIANYAIHSAQFCHKKDIMIGYWKNSEYYYLPEYIYANSSVLKFLKGAIDVFDLSSFKTDSQYIIIFHKKMKFEDARLIAWYEENYLNYIEVFIEKFGEPFYDDSYLAAFKYCKKTEYLKD